MMQQRAGWLVLVACALLLGTALSTTEGMDDESDLADVSVEAEDGEEVMETPAKGEFKLNFVDDTSDSEHKFDTFIPTKDWQTVQKGQPLPKGLHYRLNLATGLTEAKLLDDSDDISRQKDAYKELPGSLVTTDVDSPDTAPADTPAPADSARLRRMRKVMALARQEQDEKEAYKLKYWKDGNKEGMLKLKDRTFSREELKDALKKFKIRDDGVKNEASIVKSKFRSMKDIKQAFDDMQVKMKTDAEVLGELLAKYKNEQLTEQGRINILAELEYYLHQIDNAVNFADMGGLELVIHDLNSTSRSVRRDAAFVIGSATQSNPHVQVRVVKLGGVHKLVRMLSTESSDGVRSRVLYALSCTLRHFPFAQKAFVENGGVYTLTSTLSQTASPKLRLKAMTLAVDLLQEQKMAELHTTIAKPTEFEKLQQYKNVSLKGALLEQGWCALVPMLLEDPDHDAREKVLTAMTLLAPACPPEDFLRAWHTLTRLQGEYSRLTRQEVAEEGQEGYFGGVLKLVNDLVRTMDAPEKSHLHREEL